MLERPPVLSEKGMCQIMGRVWGASENRWNIIRNMTIVIFDTWDTLAVCKE